LGMEAVRKIVVRDLPAFVIYDGRGGDLYASVRP
ncbi:MAG: fumarate hydratase C-terminal domain-containing protein, partial [Candidatus Aminicenantes bacterium]|nr:fumarate hydratase C-terminal domain-containing protein [Candidatus Aminicenantes bacterium]